jgi:hypothetical protein
VFNSDTGKTILLKLQTNKHQLLSSLKPNNVNMYATYIELYQQGKLKDHIKVFPESATIYNKHTVDESYDTIGLVDASFKVLTSELLELYKIVWHIRDGSHNMTDVYKMLPSEYTTILFKIKGIYFKKKKDCIDGKISHDESRLKIKDIYALLKNYNSGDLMKLFLARKRLIEMIDKNCTSVSDVYGRCSMMSRECDSKLLTMTNIFVSNVY